MTEVIVKLTGSGGWEVPAGVAELADVLIVAGGGDGGSSSGGGGGAGEALLLENVSVTPGAIISYSVGQANENTTFDSMTARSGAAGGSGENDGNDGGSGGGGGRRGSVGGASTAVPPGLGNKGGDSIISLSHHGAGGGGGGAGEEGGDGVPDEANNVGGKGGDGEYYGDIFGDEYGDEGWFGGGGGGGTNEGGGRLGVPGEGGKGGGGAGENAGEGGESALPNTGGGGGGGGRTAQTDGSGGSGGSGVILIRYIEPSTSTSTGTGTGSTGAPQLLTPLNLFLVSISLPDEPAVEPEPEPAVNPLAGPDYIGVYDLTGATPDSRYQGTTGTTPSSDRIGRAVDLSGNGRDLTALDDDGRPKAQAGYALYDDYSNHRLASPAFPESGSETYVAVRFRQDDNFFQGNTLIQRGSDDSGSWVAGEQGNGNFRLINTSGGTILSEVTTTSGDHTLEVWAGAPARYSLDGGPILDADNDWTNGLQRLVVGGRGINIINRSWEGRIYRVVARFNSPSASDRAAITDWLES